MVEIIIGRNDMIPTRHASRVIQPLVRVQDIVMPGETTMEAGRRIGLMANAIFARETLSQLGSTDRMVSEGNEVWCDEYLSTVKSDHPAEKPNSTVKLPLEIQALIDAAAKQFAETVILAMRNHK